MKKIILDTSAFIRFFAGDERVLDALGCADSIYFSVVVLGELAAGFKAGEKMRTRKAFLDRFLEKPTVSVLPVSEETAEVFGEIKYALQGAGTPIPVNDIWIAAQAMETGSVVVTYDSHFLKVAGLRRWQYLE